MKRVFLPLTAFLCLSLCQCTKPDDPIPPIQEKQYDTLVSVVDTFAIDTVRIDTNRIDTGYYEDNQKRIVAYVSYYGSKFPKPELCTHICYAFAELYLSEDSVYQKFEVKGNESRLRSVIKLKEQNPNLKVSLSFSHTVGNPGNAQRGGFSKMSADPAQRRHFAEDCLAYCQEMGLDGIDIDWEFPGLSWSGHHCDPMNDTKNFTLLMKDLREVLGNDYLLTYAAYVRQTVNLSTGGTSYINNKAVEPYVDFINVMTYDMCSAPSPHNGFKCDGYFDISRMYNSYKAAKYPMDKLTLGIPFYGRHTYEDGEWQYNTLQIYYRLFPNEWERRYNTTWWTPVAYRNGEMWCSYDDEESIAQKGQWVNEVGLGGLMYWEVSGDDSQYTLSHACWDAMKYKPDTLLQYIYVTDTIHRQDTIIQIVERK